MKTRNTVSLEGKISHVGHIAYTPTAIPVVELKVAVGQRYFNKDSIGYFEVLVTGDLVDGARQWLRVGRKVRIEGSLWMRAYRNRQGNKVVETKVLAENIGGVE